MASPLRSIVAGHRALSQVRDDRTIGFADFACNRQSVRQPRRPATRIVGRPEQPRPRRVALANTLHRQWRNRAEFLTRCAEIEASHVRKRARELEYRLVKQVLAHAGSRIAVRFAYGCRDDHDRRCRAHGNESWQFHAAGLIAHRSAGINDHSIAVADRKMDWPRARGPDGHPALSDLGF
jgi:hypothetical protein